MAEQHQPTVLEAVAVFHDEASLDAAVDDLEEHGFDRAELSLMASEQAVEEKLGGRYERIEDAADDPSTPRTAVYTPEDVGVGEGAIIGGLAYVGAVAAAGAIVASGGTMMLAAASALAVGGGGGVLGGLLARRIGQRHAQEVEEHLKHGGLLLWVHLRDEARQETARQILGKHTKDPVRVHRIPVHDPKAGSGPELERYDVGIPWLFRRRR